MAMHIIHDDLVFTILPMVKLPSALCTIILSPIVKHCHAHFPQLPYYMMYNAGKCIFHCYLVTLSKEPDLILNESDMEHPMSSIQVISWRMKIENPKRGSTQVFLISSFHLFKSGQWKYKLTTLPSLWSDQHFPAAPSSRTHCSVVIWYLHKDLERTAQLSFSRQWS